MALSSTVPVVVDDPAMTGPTRHIESFSSRSNAQKNSSIHTLPEPDLYSGALRGREALQSNREVVNTGCQKRREEPPSSTTGRQSIRLLSPAPAVATVNGRQAAIRSFLSIVPVTSLMAGRALVASRHTTQGKGDRHSRSVPATSRAKVIPSGCRTPHHCGNRRGHPPFGFLGRGRELSREFRRKRVGKDILVSGVETIEDGERDIPW